MTNGSEWKPIEPKSAADCIEVWSEQQCGKTQYFQDSVTTASGSVVEIRLGYRRIHEFDANDKIGQDCAGLFYDGRHVVAIVADGVSQSFFGDLAAKHVSEWLLGELWRRRLDPPGKTELEEGLKVQQKLLAEKLPLQQMGDSDLMRLALEKTRLEWGSQTVFTACSFELPELRGCIYQVGDALAVLHDEGGYRTVRADAHGRWSSAGKSDLLLSRMTVKGAAALVMKTDGADKRWGLDSDAASLSGEAFFNMAKVRADQDDVCFVSLRTAHEERIVASVVGTELGEEPSRPEQDRAGLLHEPPSSGRETPVAAISGPPAVTHRADGLAASAHQPKMPPVRPADVSTRWGKARAFGYGFVSASLLAAAIIAAPGLREGLKGTLRGIGGLSNTIMLLDERVSRLEHAVEQLKGGQSPAQAGSGATTSASPTTSGSPKPAGPVKASGSGTSGSGATSGPASGHGDKGSSVGADLTEIGRDKFIADYGDEVPGDRFPGSVRSFIEESDESVVIRISEKNVPPPSRIEVDQGSGATLKKIPVPLKPGRKPMFVNIKAFVTSGDEKIVLRVFDRPDEQISPLEWNIERGKCYGVTLRRGDR